MLSSVAELGAAIFSGVGSPPLKYFGPNKIKSMSVEENKQIKNKTKNPAKKPNKKKNNKTTQKNHHQKAKKLKTSLHFLSFLPSLWKWKISLFIPFVCFYTDK